jgi:FkbM family methyltransferase
VKHIVDRSMFLGLIRRILSIYRRLIPDKYRIRFTHGLLAMVARPGLIRNGNKLQTEKYTLFLDAADIRSVVHYAFHRVYNVWYFEPFEVSLFVNAVAKNKRCIAVDIGANYGCYTLEACTQAAPGDLEKLIAIEPDRDVCRCLSRSVNENGLGEYVLVVNAAVTDKHGGYCDLFVNSLGSDDNRTVRCNDQLSLSCSYKVETVTVDGLLKGHGIDLTNRFVVKVDIQGNEPLAISGMQEMLRFARGYQLFLEFCPTWLRSAGHDPIQFAREIWALNADVVAEIRESEKEVTPIVSFDDLERIVATRFTTDLFVSKSLGLPWNGA